MVKDKINYNIFENLPQPKKDRSSTLDRIKMTPNSYILENIPLPITLDGFFEEVPSRILPPFLLTTRIFTIKVEIK